MRIDFEELMELLVVIFALYGLLGLIKKGYRKIMEIDIEKKRNFFDSAKIFLIGIIAGLLLYITPLVNETAKIIISLLLTLGAFIGTFVIKEKSGYNLKSRICVFLGQVFFGITMCLLMVNTNLGYSMLSVFGIWTIFNLYISKEFKKTENIFMFITTLIGLIGSALTIYNDMTELHMITIICVLLLAYQVLKNVFSLNENMLMKGLHNVFITLPAFMIVLVKQNMDDLIPCFVITLIFVVATLLVQFINKEKINFRSLLVYAPLAVIALMAGIEDEKLMLQSFAIYNLLTATWALSKGSVYKKLLVICWMVFLTFGLMSNMYIGGLTQLSIVAVVALSCVYLLEPKKAVELEKGDASNEE